MANSKISALSEITPTGADAFVVIDDMGGTPVERRTSLALMQTALRSIQEGVVSLTTLTADAAIVIPWASGRLFHIETAGFDITGVSESNPPGTGYRYEGSLHVTNGGVTDSACDFAAIAHGLSGVLTVPAAAEDLVLLWSTYP